MRPSRLLVLLISTAAAYGPTAGAAHAATVHATPTIQGAGTVTGPSYSCTNLDQRSSVAMQCSERAVVTNDPSFFGVSMTLTATASSTPAGHWRFVRWEGCESVQGSACTVGAPAFSGADWFPRAVFADAVAPGIVFGPSESFSLTQERTVSFSFAYNEGVTAQCRIDGEAFANCASGQTYAGLSEGDHGFDVRAFDASGNQSGNSSRTVKIVDTAIASGPAEGSLTNRRTAAFAYASVAGNAFECRLDGEAFAQCPAAGRTYSDLADGSHTFQVRAVNGGYFDRLPAERRWRIDATPPVVSLVADARTPGDGVLSTLTTATFVFAANEPGSFQCALDGAPFSGCTSPVSYGGLTTGEHQFSVRALDTAGNTGAAVERKWSVAVPDIDGDGYNANADCDDSQAGVNPGRPEIVNNDVDENCDGVREYDRDGDGSRADKDCDDNDRARTPGKAEIPGNGVDEDCDGVDALEKMSITLGARWDVQRSYTILSTLTLNGAPGGARATIRCTGPKCPKRTMTLTVTKVRQPLRAFVGRRLPAGTSITVVVSRRGYLTAVKRMTVRRGRPPVVSVQKCLPPGVSQPIAC